MLKAMLFSDSVESSNDIIFSQNRYEGLLEGAIGLYSIETTEYHTIKTITKEEVPDCFIESDILHEKSN